MACKLIFVLIAIGATVVSGDYCSLQNSDVFVSHVACPEDATPSPNCVGIPEITQEIKDLIVNEHNKLRNKLAAGNVPNQQPATRMATMQWDDELAYLAYFNSKKCSYGHDNCRATGMFPYAGQNIALSYNSGTGADYQPVLEVIANQTQAWFSEYSRTTPDYISSYHNTPDPNKAVVHFTQIVRDLSFKVGCSVSQFKDVPKFCTYYVCDYAVANNFDQPIYDVGPTATKCKTGTNPSYPALCSVNEKYEDDVWQKILIKY